MTDHPITPPPELMQQWVNEASGDRRVLITLAARWGADQELEACCEWLDRQKLAKHESLIPYLRAARRPKPPSLAEKSLDLIDKIQSNKKMWQIEELDVVRCALERLQELESNG